GAGQTRIRARGRTSHRRAVRNGRGLCGRRGEVRIVARGAQYTFGHAALSEREHARTVDAAGGRRDALEVGRLDSTRPGAEQRGPVLGAVLRGAVYGRLKN